MGACTGSPAPVEWMDPAVNTPRSDLAPDDLYPHLFAAPPTERRFVAEAEVQIVESAIRDDESIRVEQQTASDEPISRRLFSIGPAGEVLLRRSLNLQSGAEVVFDPPLIVAPVSLQPGGPFQSNTTIHSIEPGDPDAAQPGTASYTLETIAERDLQDGSREVQIRSTLVLSLGHVTITRRIDRLIAVADDDETGARVLREDSFEAVRVFGLPASSSRRSLTADGGPLPTE